ncbi:MAG TPA: amidohydrolase family protein [Feifaniaceae bacterium]|nr:amidohydrolase family protein [Feifaniaceae bacterium]
MDFLIENCTIIDGTGSPAYTGSVGFESGRMRVYTGGTLPNVSEIIDGTGLTLVPGLIDAHSHGDLTMTSVYAARAKLTQGVTTQIAGQCGISMFPAGGGRETLFTRFVSGIAPHPDFPEDLSRLSSADGFFGWVESLRYPVTTKAFVGHGTLRLWAMGYENRKPDAGELKRMEDMLRACIREGALGLSTGLVYAPSCYADNDEILALLRVVAEEGGVYATHPRNEGDGVIESRRESIRLAKEAGVPLCASHLKAAGRDNWGKTNVLLYDLERAAGEGLKVLIDCYPYDAGCTALNVSIPPRYFTRGLTGLVEALKDPIEREVVRKEVSRKADYENYVYNCGGFAGVFVSSCPVDHSAEGMFISDYAAKTGVDPFDAYCDILIKNNGLGLAVYFHMSEDDVAAILSHPLCVMGTDGLIGSASENPHPRAFGSTAHAFDLMVRKRKLLTPEQMIRKMSGQVAAFFGLTQKGRIANGCDADAVLLDLNAFCDKATYAAGSAPCEGIRAVFSGGNQIDLNAPLV